MNTEFACYCHLFVTFSADFTNAKLFSPCIFRCDTTQMKKDPVYMNKATIRLVYRKEISSLSTGIFERNLLRDTYQLLAEARSDGESASPSADVQQAGKISRLQVTLQEIADVHLAVLNRKMPDISDSNGDGLIFCASRCELIGSPTQEENQLKLALYFTSENLYLHESIGNFLILSYVQDLPGASNEAFILKLTDALTVSEYIHADTKRPIITRSPAHLN